MLRRWVQQRRSTNYLSVLPPAGGGALSSGGSRSRKPALPALSTKAMLKNATVLLTVGKFDHAEKLVHKYPELLHLWLDLTP